MVFLLSGFDLVQLTTQLTHRNEAQRNNGQVQHLVSPFCHLYIS
jgi:hypothetical protein